MSLWTDLRDTAESAAVVAGNYVLPGSSLITSKLVSDGSKQQLNSDLGTLAQLASGGAGAWEGNLANYQTAANSVLGSVSPGTTVESLSQATGLSGAQLAKLGITAASLLAGGAAASNLAGSNTGGLTGMTTQDRSGFSSGSANYSPEYYASLQSKYNQYMPQQQGKDITTDLKNWYDTKYTPQATVATTPTSTTTGTGYTTPSSMTGLGIKVQPLYTGLTSNSTTDDIAKAYAQVVAQGGGNTVENRQAAINYLTKLGIGSDQINAAYSKYLSTLPATTGTTAETLAANSTPEQIAQAYAGYVNASGGDTQANQVRAIEYLRKVGIPDATIQAAYPIYRSSVQTTSAPSTGMLTAVPTASPVTSIPSTEQPLYTQLSSSSSPSDIAKAYAQFASAAGGDTQANQEAAVNYLSNLGISNDNILQAYGLFKG